MANFGKNQADTSKDSISKTTSEGGKHMFRDAKSGQRGQHACAIFSTGCANFWAVYAQNLQTAQVVVCTIAQLC